MNAGGSAADTLRGEWRLTRRVIDKLGFSGRLLGRARFEEDGASRLQVETGALRTRHGAFNAERRFIWRLEPEQLHLCYESGAPLVSFDRRCVEKGEKTCAEHQCGADAYVVAMRLESVKLWRLSWRVRGPRKDYRLCSRFERP